MMKYILAFTLLCFCIACDQPAKTAKPVNPKAQKVDNRLLITPGGGIGMITIGEDVNNVIKTLGTPDAGDAAMGSQMMTWYDNHQKAGHRLTVFSHRQNGGPNPALSEVKAIRATSPKFNTTDMVHTGMPVNEIKKHFSLKRTQSSGVTIYTDNASGIAFEVDAQDNCSAIIVFARSGLVDTYLNMRD